MPYNGIGVPKFLLFKQRFYLSLIVLLSLFSSSSIFAQRTIGDAWIINRGDATSELVAVDECAEGTTPSYGSATADGVTSDWDLTNDFFADMYEAGNPEKDLLSKAYLRYDCETNTLCVLVVMESGQPADQSAADSWMKVYDISNSTQVDGNSSAFAWLPNQGGWEGCFQLAEASYAEVEIHVNTNGRTSSTGKRAQGYKPLCIMCPDCPPAGQSCDDGDASTENDMTDGECGCAGTPCPDAGQTCDDGDASTENDMTDGECGCAGTPCPDAGQTCDDGDASTENDMTDGECGCAGTPCPDAGQTCDDGDASTENDMTDGECGCAGTPCPDAGQTCDDGDASTENDMTDGECGCAGTPCPDAGQTCDDGDASTENDMTDGECGCAGTPCPDAGQTCDDGDASTENDMTDGECGCAGTPCPDAGQTCDDGDASTENDMTDGECGCAGTPCPDAGQTCDDGDASTENDMTDGECGCAGTPCPDAGQTCDDGDASTENDMTDGECGCAGTPCPDAGQTCDDGDASTENDMTDGECGCAGTPCTAEGKDCDDYDCNTYDYYDTSICDCVNEPIPYPTCDDGDECTTDYYDAANCECVNEPVDDLSCGEGTIDCEGQTDAAYDPDSDTYTLYADGCWHDCLSPDRDVHFYQELCGDGELVAHIASLSGKGYGGIVMREGLDPVARRAGAMTKLHTNTIRKEYRAEYGAPVHQMPKFRRDVEWFKMVRLGDKIKIYTSERGNSWRLLYQIVLPNLAECLDAGMMAYTINGSSDVTVVFDNVSLTPADNFFVDNNTGPDFEYEEQLLPLADNITPNADPFGKVQWSDTYQGNQKLAVYPNPANQQVFVNLPAIAEGQTGILSLYNNLGQEVLRKQVDAEVTRTESIRLNELGAGVYLFKLQVKGQADLTQRLIIGRN